MDASLSANSFPAPSFLRRSNFGAPVLLFVRQPVLKPEGGGDYSCHVQRNIRLPVMVVQRIEGVNEELNAMAAKNPDHASARRNLRSAFVDIQLHLDHCLFKWYERNSRGLRIFCKSWKPEQVAIVKVLCFSAMDMVILALSSLKVCLLILLSFIPEQSRKFLPPLKPILLFWSLITVVTGIARFITTSGYCVYAIDHPGFGISDGLHGYVHSFDELADNVIEQYTKIRGQPNLRGLPCYLLGQSMGGAVALKVHLKNLWEWDGMVLVAPMCRVGNQDSPSNHRSSAGSHHMGGDAN